MYSTRKIKNLIYSKKIYFERIAFFLYTVVLFIPLIFLRFLGYKLARIKSDRVGHLVSETFTIKNDFALKPFKIIFLLKKNSISNLAYIEMFKSKYKNIFINLPEFIHRSIRLPDFFMINVDDYNTTHKKPMKSYSIYAKKNSFFKTYDLPKNSNTQYKSFIRNFKIVKNEKIVILHFRSSQSSFSDEKEHLSRNVSPKSYYGLIKFLCRKGYRVIRIGDNGVNIDIKDKNFINYGNLNIKSGYLDLALVANCNFFIGSSTGAIYIAAVFGKPILGLNMCMPFNFSPSGKQNEIGVPKLIINKNNNKVLTLNQIYHSKIYTVRSAEDPLMKQFDFIDNEEDDLTKATEEMLEFLRKPSSHKKYKKLNCLIRGLNKNFEVDAGSLSNFSISFFNKYKSNLLEKVKE